MMFEGPPESAHCRSTYAWEPGVVTGIGTPKLAPSSVEVATYMLWFTVPEARLWKSRYARSPGPVGSHGRSWSASSPPGRALRLTGDRPDVVQFTPPSSEYDVRK